MGDLTKIESYVATMIRTRAKPAEAKLVGELGLDIDLAFAFKNRNRPLAITAIRACLMRAYGDLGKLPAPIRSQMVAIGVL